MKKFWLACSFLGVLWMLFFSSCSEKKSDYRLHLTAEHCDAGGYICLLYLSYPSGQVIDTLRFTTEVTSQKRSLGDSLRSAYLVAGDYDAVFALDFVTHPSISLHIDAHNPWLSYLEEKNKGGSYAHFARQNSSFLQRYYEVIERRGSEMQYRQMQDSLRILVARFWVEKDLSKEVELRQWVTSLFPFKSEQAELAREIQALGGNPANLLVSSNSSSALSAFSFSACSARDTIQWSLSHYPVAYLSVVEDVHQIANLRIRPGKDTLCFVLSLEEQIPLRAQDSLPPYTFLLDGGLGKRLRLASALNLSQLPLSGLYRWQGKTFEWPLTIGNKHQTPQL